MDEDPEVLPDNGVEPEALQPLDVVTETVPAETAESEETTEALVSPFEGKPLEEIAKDPNVEKVLRDQLARQAESFRQKQEHEARLAQDRWEAEQYQGRRAQAEQVRAGTAYNGLKQIVERAIERGEAPPPQALAPIAQALANQAFMDWHDARVDYGRRRLQEINPDWRPTQPAVENLERARRSADPWAVANAEIALTYDAAYQHSYADAYQRAYADIQEQMKVANVKTASAQRATQPRATTGIGARSPGGTNHDAVLSSSIATLDTKAAAFKAKYGFDAP